jgi:MoaA/NifB/PqqE/SkfB family radical SAM enzyme
MMPAFLRRLILAAENAVSAADVKIAQTLRRAPHVMPVLLCFATWRCNLRCAMCGVHLRRGEAEELSLEEWAPVFEAAKRLKTRLMLLSGGEVLARGEDFTAGLIGMAAETRIATHLCTNGVLVTEETVRRLRDAGLRSVSISLDSPEAAAHNAIRGEGAFEKAVNAIRLFRAGAPEISTGINFTLTSGNFRQAVEMIDFAETLDMHQLKFAPIHTNLLHREKPRDAFEALMFREDQLDELDAEINRVIERLKQSPLLSNQIRYLRGIAASFREPQPFRCAAGYLACTLDPAGRVSPCTDLESGLSVREAPLDEIWRGEAYQALRRKADACARPCWDTLYTEMSLRLGGGSLFSGPGRFWRELAFYYGRNPL